MSIKKAMLLMGLCALFTGCSTGGYYGDGMIGANESSSQRGVRYLLGRGVSQNNEKAFSYFSQAANEEDPFAQNEVAFMYAAGKGTSQDYSKALLYYRKAADHGLASAQYSLGQMYLYGLGTTANKTLAMQWFKKSAAHGFEPAKQVIAQG
jgi:uncharacterized protein